MQMKSAMSMIQRYIMMLLVNFIFIYVVDAGLDCVLVTFVHRVYFSHATIFHVNREHLSTHTDIDI